MTIKRKYNTITGTFSIENFETKFMPHCFGSRYQIPFKSHEIESNLTFQNKKNIKEVESLSVITENIKTLFYSMRPNKNMDKFSDDAEDNDIINLFEETIKNQEKLDSHIQKKIVEYEELISKLTNENVLLKQRILDLEAETVKLHNQVGSRKSEDSAFQPEFPSSISCDFEDTVFYNSKIATEKEDIYKLTKSEKDFKYQDLSFDFISSEKLNVSSKIEILDHKKYSTPLRPIEQSSKTIDSNKDLLDYSPYKDLLDIKWQRYLCMTGSKLESLKPLWEAILKKIPFNQWTNSVYICWLKNFILFPPEVIPDALEIIKTMKYKSFNMKKEFKKRKKRNQIQSLKVILAVKEIIDHLALNLAKIDNIMYLNKCMHHIWLSNVFLTHIGLPHLFSIFHEYLIDSRILEAMDEDNYKYYLKLSSRYQRKCLYYGVEFLKSIHFDRKNFDEIIHKEEEYMDEIKFWSNNRFLRWLSTYLKIDPILTSVLNSSGICGFIIYYQPNETSAYLKDILHQYFDNEKMHNFILEFENLTRYLYPQKMISQ